MPILNANSVSGKNSLTKPQEDVLEENEVIGTEKKVPENKLENYLEPAYSGVEYGIPTGGASPKGESTKDQYEDNNSFEDAYLLFENDSGEPGDQNDYIFATLHYGPWYHFWWRTIDEDYYRFDVLGDATVTIELTDIPNGCDYDIELYKHDNVKHATFNNVSLVNFSRKEKPNDERIIHDVTPGTYYIRVYSAEGYSGDDYYELSYNLVYKRISSTSIADLRFNKGAKAAVWTSDFAPFEIKPFNLKGKEYVGFKEHSGESGYFDYYANPIHNTIKARANGSYITQSVLYIWDNELQGEIRDKLILIAEELDELIVSNQEFIMKFDLIILGSGLIFSTISIVANGTGALLGTVGGILVTYADLLIPMMFPEKWETNSQTALSYIERLIAALEVSEQPSTNEAVKIEFRHKYEYDFFIWAGFFVDAVGNTIQTYNERKDYYLDFAYSPDSSYNFKYKIDDIPQYNTDAYTLGKTYGLRDSNDLVNFYEGHPETNLPDINTSPPTEVFLEDSYSGYLSKGEYCWYEFSAPTLGNYEFTTFGSTDTYGELFWSPVAGNSIEGRLAYDDDNGLGANFKINYELEAGEKIYIRVRAEDWSKIGGYSFLVTFQEIPITTAFLDNVYPGVLTTNQVYWYKFTAPNTEEYIFETIGNMDTYGELFSTPVARKNYTGLIVCDDDSGTGKNCRIIFQLSEGETIYIRVRSYNWTTIGSFSFSVCDVKELSLVLDPPNMALHGTEVTMNGGIKGGTTMTIGYTRNAYLENSAPSTSRLNYTWSVSNSYIAKVSAYGTITALNPGTVEIIATYKEDTSYIAKVLITVYLETSSTLKILEFTTDNRESPNPAGTEVTMNGGTPGEFTIHKGYTRFINFSGAVPNTLLQDYTWNSSHSSVLRVDIYGIVTAYSYNITVPTLVTITCVYKYNPLFQGTVTFVVYP